MTVEAIKDRVSINESPRPRLLIRGFTEQYELVQDLLKLAPTSRAISSLHEVRQAEWDILITDQLFGEPGAPASPRPVHLAEHVSVVMVCPPIAIDIEDSFNWKEKIRGSIGHLCGELQRINGLPERIAMLTHEQLEPIVRARSSHQYFSNRSDIPYASGGFGGGVPDRRVAPPALEAFIASAEGMVLAGRYARSEKSEAWLLPHDVPDIRPWVRAALSEWHRLAPERFPGVPDWSETDEWMTSAELELQAKLRNLQDEREQVLLALAQRDSTIQSDLRAARLAADEYERALLTAQSDDLVSAVTKALTEMGFKVENVDDGAEPGDHLEDLLVEDPHVPDWIAIAEVKGYTKGAKTEALIQLARFEKRYYQRTGCSVSASWYVVNQFLGRDPSTRQPVLNGRDADVAAFAEDSGLVIDTTQLFKLLLSLRDERISSEDARLLLRASTGRLALPAATDDD